MIEKDFYDMEKCDIISHTRRSMFMKKLALALAMIIALTGCGSAGSKEMQKTTAEEVIHRLQLDGENTFLLVLTTTNCYSCDEYNKVVEQLEDEKEFDIYYIDVNNETKDNLDELKITLGEYVTLPMTYYFEQGDLKAENIKSNYIELEVYREWLKQLKIF